MDGLLEASRYFKPDTDDESLIISNEAGVSLVVACYEMPEDVKTYVLEENPEFDPTWTVFRNTMIHPFNTLLARLTVCCDLLQIAQIHPQLLELNCLPSRLSLTY